MSKPVTTTTEVRQLSVNGKTLYQLTVNGELKGGRYESPGRVNREAVKAGIIGSSQTR